MNKKVFYRLAKQMSIPIIVGILYVLWNFRSDIDSKTIPEYVGLFFVALFFSSWFVGQFLRTKKQIHDEENLDKINQGIEDVTEKMQDLKRELVLSDVEVIKKLKISSENIDYEQIEADSLAQDQRVALLVYQILVVAQGGGMRKSQAKKIYESIMSSLNNIKAGAAEHLLNDLRKMLEHLDVRV